MADNWLDHQKRWNIESSEVEAFGNFKYRMRNSLLSLQHKLSAEEAELVNFIIGRTVAGTRTVDRNQPIHTSQILREDLIFLEYITRLQVCFNALERLKATEKREVLYHVTEGCLTYTPQVGIELHKGKERVILYPKGAKLLDDEVVNKTLSWLETHPKVLQHFNLALRLYMDNDKAKQRSLRGELHFSMEQLLKEVLQNNKNLANQSNDLKNWLKAKDAHPQVANLYGQLLFGPYTVYQDDVKHTGNYKEQDLEFIIYLTATFMRQLLELERSM